MKAQIYSLTLCLTLLLVTACPVWSATSLPVPEGRVNDFGHFIEKKDIARLEDLLKDFEYQTAIEIVVVTSADQQIERRYAQDLFDFWQVGKADLDNGVLILINAKGKSVVVLGSMFRNTLSTKDAETLLSGFPANVDKKQLINRLIEAIPALERGLNPQAGDTITQEQAQTPLTGWTAFVLFYASMGIFPWLGAVLTRSNKLRGGALIGGIIGLIMTLFGGDFLGVILFVVLGLQGLMLDFTISKNFERSQNQEKSPAWWAGGMWA